MRLIIPLLLVGIAWSQELFDQLLFGGVWNLPLGTGLPWWRIFTAPFSHSGFSHLLSNTFTFLPLSWLVLSKSVRDYIAIWISVLFLEIPIAFFWPTATHGLSGVVYGILGYLLLIGLLEKRLFSILLSGITILIYGSALTALIPVLSPAGISWVSHFSGFIGGFFAACAFYEDD